MRAYFQAHEEPVRLVVVFGSTARGTARADSDVDVGVLFRGDVSLRAELALEARLERAAGKPVEIVRLDEASEALRFRAARDGAVVFADPPYERARFVARAAIEHDDTRELREEAMRRFSARVIGGT